MSADNARPDTDDEDICIAPAHEKYNHVHPSTGPNAAGHAEGCHVGCSCNLGAKKP